MTSLRADTSEHCARARRVQTNPNNIFHSCYTTDRRKLLHNYNTDIKRGSPEWSPPDPISNAQRLRGSCCVISSNFGEGGWGAKPSRWSLGPEPECMARATKKAQIWLRSLGPRPHNLPLLTCKWGFGFDQRWRTGVCPPWSDNVTTILDGNFCQQQQGQTVLFRVYRQLSPGQAMPTLQSSGRLNMGSHLGRLYQFS